VTAGQLLWTFACIDVKYCKAARSFFVTAEFPVHACMACDDNTLHVMILLVIHRNCGTILLRHDITQY